VYSVIMKNLTKPEFIAKVQTIAGDMDKSSVLSVLDAICKVCVDELKSNGAVIIPGLARLTLVKRAAMPERQGISPFTKQLTTLKAKPASVAVKIKPVKAIKDAVS